MGSLGTGITLEPKDDNSLALKKAIESVTRLRVNIPNISRDISGLEKGYFLTIGVKPLP